MVVAVVCLGDWLRRKCRAEHCTALCVRIFDILLHCLYHSMLYSFARSICHCEEMLSGGVILSILISLTWIGTMVYYMVIKGISLPLIVYAGALPCWIMFFVLGVVLGIRKRRECFLWIALSITIVGFTVSVVSSRYLYDVYHGGYGIKPSSFVYAFGAILFLFDKRVETLVSNHRNMIFRSMVWLGKISFAVYLIHIYMVNFVVNRFTIDSWFLRTVFALVLTVLFIVILKRLIPERLHKYIGI